MPKFVNFSHRIFPKCLIPPFLNASLLTQAITSWIFVSYVNGARNTTCSRQHTHLQYCKTAHENHELSSLSKTKAQQKGKSGIGMKCPADCSRLLPPHSRLISELTASVCNTLIPLQIPHCLKLPFPVKRGDALTLWGRRDIDIWIRMIKCIQLLPSPAQTQRQSASTQSLYTSHRTPVWLASSSKNTYIQQVAKPPQIQPPPQN